MKISEIPVPEVYKESADFRFFLKWFETCLSKIKYDTDNMLDLYDPQRCPSNLLWLLADTMGFKYDTRLCTAFNRLVLLYFVSMIRNKGSKTGVTLAAEVNLAQFNINNYGKEKDILYDRLEDTSIPVNSVYVTPHTKEGYIDIVYFSTEKPIDACVEYVRPLGMYLFDHAGVRFDARTKISIDARLTNTKEIGVSIGATHVGHYTRADYASMQHTLDSDPMQVDMKHERDKVWYRNSDAEGERSNAVDPGWRSLFSLQLSNNEHIVESLIPEKDKIFSIGYEPQKIDTFLPDDYLDPNYIASAEYRKSDDYRRPFNLRYDRKQEEAITQDVYTVDADRTKDILNPRPAVNPVMSNIGDAIALYSLPEGNTADEVNIEEYTDNTEYSDGDGTNRNNKPKKTKVTE